MKRLYVGIALLLLGCAAALADDLLTRFGALTINEEKVLLFRGTPVSPEVKGNASLSVIEKFEMGASDVVLIRDNGGTACPALFHFVTLSASGAKATPAFGTCSDLVRAARRGDTITVSMPGYRGPFESSAGRAKAAKEKHVFTFSNGIVTENGKPAR